jgi:hypothetical protein
LIDLAGDLDLRRSAGFAHRDFCVALPKCQR